CRPSRPTSRECLFQPEESCASRLLLRDVLHLQFSVLNAHRQWIKSAWSWSTNPRAVRREVALVTRTRKAIRILIPRDLATLVRADSREHLIILCRQDVDVVLFRGDRPTRDVFGDDLTREWL